MFRRWGTCVGVATTLIATGCKGNGGVTLSDAQAVFDASCAGTTCHVGYRDAPGGELDLSPEEACTNLIMVPAVEQPAEMRLLPGVPGESYLLCKLDPDCPDLPPGAETMPVAADPLPPAQIEMFRDWIATGAPGCPPLDTAAPTFAGASSATPLPSAIRLAWAAATDDTSSPERIIYLVYEAAESGGQNFAQPSFVTAPGATEFVDDGLPVSTERFYVVRARDEGGNSDSNSVEVSAVTPAVGDETPPTFAGATSATPAGSTAVMLHWNPGSDDVSPPSSLRYRAYVAISSGNQNFSSPAATSAPGATELLITGLTAETTYFFVVRAIDGINNEETNLVEVSATTNGILSFSADIQPILTANCIDKGCHTTPVPKEDLDLRAGVAYGELVGVASQQCTSRLLVDAGSPQTSYLIDKINGTNLCFGTKMPKTGTLSAMDRQAIADWISQGAANN